MVYPVQAGVSLHQAPHLVERGLDPTTAAMIVGSFSLMSGIATIACGLFAPASCSRSTAMICSSVNLIRFIVRPFIEAGL